MTEPQKPSSSWWQTLPGVLTALTATITAISGLAALLFQNGVIGHKAEAKAESQPIPHVASTAPVAPTEDPSRPTGSPPSNAPNNSAATTAKATPRPWADAEAVLLKRDGTTARVRASSFSNCISVNHEISLDNGQSIAFEKMAGFDVIQADDHTNANAKAKLKLLLANGSEISGTVEANCDLFGTNDIGRVTTYYDQLRGVRFE
ncbi:MAG: hypothetical protein ACOZE7_05185 [Pseudomonadota bacterium]